VTGAPVRTVVTSVPKHIAVIMDGNRRFSRRLMAKPWKGHEWGAKKVESFLEWCLELGVHEVTLYAFSIQNFSRPKDEFEMLMGLFERTFCELTERAKAGETNAAAGRIRFIGRRELFPEAVQNAMRALEEGTSANTRILVNIAMAYGGREEVIDAVRRLSERVERGELAAADVNEETFGQELYMQSEPDLVIRTGGEHRTSNFLIWQSSYAEWVFVEKAWPEFEKDDFLTALTDYAERDRRFGK
jgi:tritrans,polycis-undecaprenyl-diphosphate synthase [geranylgeranyl-diphosphate specific]